MDTLVCRGCGAENADGTKFCVECGTALALRCPACGAAHAPGQRFCGECGVSLAVPAAGPAAAELRLASVLFVDLVGWTTLAESRDAEDARELLSRYFDTARAIVDRHGGTIEKFIGDAVMAVWGAPVAREDDAERAVRAGLELVDAVTAFGETVGAPRLRARAGVVTGQVASVSNPGEGLVVGDRVNTASRVQSTAEPGTVYVDEVTRQATAAAIAYADAGEHTVKGKAEPLRLWRAQRVVAGVGGAQREAGLEAPFCGREHELRLVKDLFHATVERGGVRLVAVTGPAGVGKSRLHLEFSRYTDGLADLVLWHSGRCLAYGEGIAYWALAEMVRQRLDLPEDASAPEAARKLAAALERWVTEPHEREFLSPRLGALLGISDAQLSRAELFAGWRLFFERLASHHPLVLVFEDLQWADDGLLDFIEHLLDWAAQPIFVLALARPELLGRRGGWAARPGVTTVALEPLAADAVGELLDGLVTGLPSAVRARIVAQAEGVPLYAIETVRALLDRGLLAHHGDGGLIVTGEIADLAIPASLSSLLTARLDGLEPDERALVKALAAMSGSFPRATVRALSDLDDVRLDALLESLVHKQVLVVRADPLSPERGQYAFAQSLLRTVAYDLLSRRERKARHLAIAAHLRRAFSGDGEEVAEVIAGHLLDACRAAAEDPDAGELRAAALAALRRSAQRARTIGAPEASERALRTAMDLAGDEAERAELAEAAGEAAFAAGRYELALEHFEAAEAAHAAAGRRQAAARAAGGVGRMLTLLARDAEAVERLTAALEVLEAEGDSDVSVLSTELGTSLFFSGQVQAAVAPLERGLVLAQRLGLRDAVPHAMHRLALVRSVEARMDEARALYEEAIRLAERLGRTDELLAAQNNSSDLMLRYDVPGGLERSLAALATARRLGNRGLESVAAANTIAHWTLLGRWEEIDRLDAELVPDDGSERPDADFVHALIVEPALLRGDVARARERLSRCSAFAQAGEGTDMRQLYEVMRGLVMAASGEEAAGLAGLLAAMHGSYETLGASAESLRTGAPYASDLALHLGRLDDAADVLAIDGAGLPGELPPLRQAERLRSTANLAAARGEHETVEADLHAAIEGFERLGYVYWLAHTRLDLAAWRLDRGRAAEAWPLVDLAEAVLTSLGARPALERCRGLRAAQPAEV